MPNNEGNRKKKHRNRQRVSNYSNLEPFNTGQT